MKKEFRAENCKFVLTVGINNVHPDYHTVSITGVNTRFHKQVMCSTAELEVVCSNMEYNARLSVLTSWEAGDRVKEILTGIGFQELNEADLKVVE